MSGTKKIATDLSNLYRVLGESGESLTVEHMEDKEAKIHSELEEIERRIADLRKEDGRQIEEKKNLNKGIIENLRQDIAKLTSQIGFLRSEISELEYSMEDSKELVRELSKNIQQLADGQTTGESLGGLSFDFCPACYTVIEETDDHSCHLCKTKSDDEGGEERLGRVRAQIEMQIKESDRLIKLKAERRAEKQKTVAKLEALRQGLQQEYHALRADYASEQAVEVEQAISERGYKRRELEEIANKKERIRFLVELQEYKAVSIQGVPPKCEKKFKKKVKN